MTPRYAVRPRAATVVVRPADAPGVQSGVAKSTPPPRRNGQRPVTRAGGVRSTTTGARFDPLLPFETWKNLGAKLGTYADATSWWLGDWLIFGRMKYGRRYKEAIAATGLDYQTLRNYAVVARRFDLSRRRDCLTFQHHAELCALTDPEQELWLDRAAAEGWSRNELRRRLRSANGASAPADEIFRLAVAHEQAERWREAAQRSRCGCEAWMVRVLDEAAGAGSGDRPSRAGHAGARASGAGT